MKKIIFSILCLLTISLAFGQATANQPADLETCDDTPNPNDGFATFNLILTEAEILGAQNPANYIVSFYETLVDANSDTNAIMIPTAYMNIVNPQSIYARVENLGNGDFDVTNFAIIVLPNPFGQAPTPLEECDDDNDGFAEFDLTNKDNEITGGAPTVTVSYHIALGDAINGTNALVSPYTNSSPNIQIIYIRVQDDNTGCVTLADMDIIVNSIPDVQQPNNLFINEGDGDGVAVFDLTVNDAVVSDGITNAQVFYFETLVDAAQLINQIDPATAYTNISNPQEIFVAAQNGDTQCYDVVSFFIATDETDAPDTDSDGVPDAIEDINANGDLTDDDTDNDTIPNYQDDDDDGDGTITALEDYNGNGSPTDDDTNNNRVPDYLDDAVVLNVSEVAVPDVILYPNPVTNTLSVSFGNSTEIKSISIFGITGNLISEEIISEATTIAVDTSMLVPGMYFVRFSSEGNITTMKFIKK